MRVKTCGFQAYALDGARRKTRILGTAATIGILANPRYTYFMNAAAHRGAHDGNAERLRTVRRCAERPAAQRSFQPFSGTHRASSQGRQTSRIK
jgi:hypothetical protein